ncbi:hypothetical protein BU24DRAFT_495013 [Aaosphaeria arxii CBS 175.79]|uniref:E3 ubiquitin-protein ligase listerin n=1 Tax=Aaosphaeria arxii CBS 175.79 TaxID=1450172 RepID=A0A6A5XFP3_9PLEO|nr:uncharacterized protein BU24DRAFT_495013 [Aaosphaeria arxii CBS 175.79]KAF2011902.1 hypothetical protein BU24DRAFT_495013 [Aaosphaeria arxii CBS 175.79]
MSKRSGKSHASSARAATSTFGSGLGSSTSSAFGTSSSQLSYIAEPPDLSSISDPNVVVYFRNLSKKDSTTKAKALEDIQAYISTLQEPVEDGILEAWIKTFPRTSIDNSKAVRQNAHALHGLIAVSAGKRLAKHMPKSVGAWLSGLYDADRSVTEATQNSLRQVFSTAEKIQNIRRAYQQPILEYCRDAIDKETTQTLSDERTVSKDDAEAKYSRVVAACISLIGSLISNLKVEELSKLQAEYDSLLGDSKVWAFAAHTDPSIRRALHRFLKACIAKQPESVEKNLDAISKAYLSVALNSDQLGSAYDFVEAVAHLTSTYPTAWTDHYKSKTSVDRRLRQCVKKGSQFGPPEYWDRVVDIIKNLPSGVVPQNSADTAEFLSALHAGVTRREEPRRNLESAWTAYLDILDFVIKSLPVEDRSKVLSELVLPIISQFLRPDPGDSQWALPPNSSKLVQRLLLIERLPETIEESWPSYVQGFIDDVKTSAPEQSKDYDRSQGAIIKQASRFATFQQHASSASPALRTAFVASNQTIITEALAVVKNRNGKPYGGAGAVTELLSKSKPLLLGDATTKETLENFVEHDIPELILSPSSSQLVDILYIMSDSECFESAWSASLKHALAAPDSPAKSKALETLLTSSKIPSSFNLASADDDLQSHIKSSVRATLQGALEWDSFSRILQSPATILSSETTDDLLAAMAQSLTLNDQVQTSLQGFRQLVKHSPTVLKDYIPTPNGSALLRSLLLASESPNEEIAQEAAAVNSSIQALLAAESDSKQSVFNVIQHGLANASQTSVSVETLVDLAKQLVKPGEGWEQVKDVFPKVEHWQNSLKPFLDLAPKSSLAVTNPLAGAVYLVDQSGPMDAVRKLDRDVDGYSPAYRTAQYVARLLKNRDLFSLDVLPSELKDELVHNLALTLQLSDDNLGLAGSNNLWAVYNTDVEAEAISFQDDARELIKEVLTQQAQHWESMVSWACTLLSTIEHAISAQTYYEARVRSELISKAIEIHGWNTSDTAEMQEQLKTFRRAKNVFALVGFLNAFKEPLTASKACERMCNELVADLTGLQIDAKPQEGLRQLVLLNSLLYGQEDIAQCIAKQRVIFFVKHVVPWLQEPGTPLAIRAELCRVLAVCLPLMGDIYGEHWDDILSTLAASWMKMTEVEENESGMDSPVPYAHGSLKLLAQLRILAEPEDSSDDLSDAWKETESRVAAGLLNLLKHSQHFPDEFHQPLKIVNDVLARQISKVPFEHLESTEELFPLLYVESQPVQQSAFDILHKQIPALQEQISIDAALDKSTARLPEELLSLILEAPTVAALADADFERSIPLPLRGYLLSWLLVFDHLEHASFKVKNDYIDHLKEYDYLPGLLDFTFDFLGHAQSKPVDVSKFDVTSYTPDLETPRKDTQWLLSHLYFLCLRHISSLTRSWWIGSKSRAIAATLEPWTEKYISPPVISGAFKSVSEWNAAQIESDPDSPFTVKVSPRAREIIASYLVDEQTMSIRISLPAAFPLANVQIEGINRVAIKEQKWQSYLRISLGAITIFNGSLIDALTTFKRNVDGVLEGQVECAICYSIVGSDKKLPDKKCLVCKNIFHGSCLFKWFKTSSSSSCPLCRNPFTYG